MSRLISARRTLVAMALALMLHSASAFSQSHTPYSYSSISSYNFAFNSSPSWGNASSSAVADLHGADSDGALAGEALPAAPEPAGMLGGGGGYDHYSAEPAARWYQRPLSRVGFGADVSLLGFGFKSALELNQNFDVRVLGNYFSYPNAHFKVEGYDVDADIHFASASASLDWYPFANGSIWRISPGVMFYNQNGLTASGGVAGGSNLDLGGTTYWSANANPATGATPLTGTGGLSLHNKQPAFMLTTGFGSFVPRSKRHWSFPTEFGVILTGSPTVNMHLGGWACLDQGQTQCTNIADPANPIAIEFNQQLNARIQHWQEQVNKVSVYPVFSYSVMYSFDIPGRRP